MRPHIHTTAGLAFILVLLGLPCYALAAHPLITDDAGTVGATRFQAESSLELVWDTQGETSSASQTLSLAVTGGIADSLDLVLTIPYSWQSVMTNGSATVDTNGLNDVSVALKWRFLEAGCVSMALKPTISFPTGDYGRGLGMGHPSFGATFITSLELKPMTIHANVGYTHQKYTDAARDVNREDLLNLSVAATASLSQPLQIVAEMGAATNPDKASKVWPLFITGGLIYSASESVDLDLGIKGGLNGPEIDIALLTGVTAKF